MEKRYFQHLNPNDERFQAVTMLDYIDDTDPTFVLYHFKDGSKCSKDFIGKLNDLHVFKSKEFAEVSSPTNIWKFKKVESAPEIKTAVGKDGIAYESADPYTSLTHKKVGVRYDIINTPSVVDLDGQSINFNISEDVSTVDNVPYDFQAELEKNSKVADAIVINDNADADIEKPKDLGFSLERNHLKIDNDLIQNLINSNATVEFNFNGMHYDMPAQTFFTNSVTNEKEKIVEVEKIVEKEVIKEKIIDEHIDIDLSEEQKGLIDNMIDMSQKENCDIDMEISLSLPPTSVYNLIKSVYPKGMAKGFVDIIADRMQIKELKHAVAEGLLCYYDGDTDIDIENEEKVEETEVSKVEVKEDLVDISSNLEKKANKKKGKEQK